MRYLAILFTIFVLSLSVWPCCDDASELSSTEQHLTENQDCGTNENPHACSPFFHCGSCQSFAVAPPISLMETLGLITQKNNYTEIPASPIILFPGDIWQPPQLV